MRSDSFPSHRSVHELYLLTALGTAIASAAVAHFPSRAGNCLGVFSLQFHP